MTLPEGVRPVIRERDFTVATIAPPTVLVEAEPTAAAAEGAPAEDGEAAAPEAAAAPGATPAAATPAKKS
jgi:large subunit ribosomal protein L25